MDYEKLGSTLGNALGDALMRRDEAARADEDARAEALLAKEEEERERQRLEEREDRFRRALEGTIHNFTNDVGARSFRVKSAVDGYASLALEKVTTELKRDPRMPRTINYKERYRALLAMEDRAEMLRRVEQTISLAERILASVPQLDVDAAVREAAGRLRYRMLILDGLKVAEPEEAADDLEASDGPHGTEEMIRAVSEAISKAFSSFVTFSPESQEERDAKELARLIDEARRSACAAADAVMASSARGITGAGLELSRLPSFSNATQFEFIYPVEDVADLAREVRRSFATYSQVVRDNGLFGAFSDGGPYGACDRSLRWLCHGDGSCRGFAQGGYGISQAIDEDSVGNTPREVALFMAELNKRPYNGLFDDDFAQHVDAFWFGFEKLMVFVNGLCEVDAKDYSAYTSKVRLMASDRARSLGAQMSPSQVARWRADVDELKKRMENPSKKETP